MQNRKFPQHGNNLERSSIEINECFAVGDGSEGKEEIVEMRIFTTVAIVILNVDYFRL